MEERIQELQNFIEKFGIDFLEDGTKAKIIESLKSGDTKVALEILNSIDSKWIDRTKEIGKFLIFSDLKKWTLGESRSQLPFFKANYIDSLELKTMHIPTLRRVVIRDYDRFIDYDEWTFY